MKKQEMRTTISLTNISPEDDQALTGVLTEDAYRNDYFGITINKIEGGTIESLMDSGTDIMPLSETYTNGNGCIMISTRSAYNECSISMTVSAVTSKDQGKKEEDLAQERYDLEQGINEAMGYKAECAVETINIAGEDHHAYTEISNTEGGRAKSATVCIIKGDFQAASDSRVSRIIRNHRSSEQSKTPHLRETGSKGPCTCCSKCSPVQDPFSFAKCLLT